ncbi:MAG: hypothetical protein ACHQ53_03185 [Polyangiales bacterium]
MVRFRLTALVVLFLGIVAVRPARADGTWTMAPPNPTTGGQAFGLWLLTDGTVLSHGSALNHWVILTPDKKGSYANGTWKSVASSMHARGGATQHMLKDGRFFQAGGEYVDGPACTAALCKGTEIYDPVADAWKEVAPGTYEIADTGSATLSDGRLLYSSRSGKQTMIYDPVMDKWTDAAPLPLMSGDENAWAALQNGGILAVGYKNDGAAIYDPATDKWQRTGPMPSGFDTGDTGGISLMFDGRVYVYGLGQSYIYTPGATAADPGTWAPGPMLLNGDRAEDEYSDTLPNGKVWGGLVTMTYGPGVVLQEFDPTTNTSKSATPPPDMGNPYPIDYVNLPNGQVMVTAERNDWIYTPDTQPQDEWRPTVSDVALDSGTTYTLTGTQLSGLINGADEGDDMTMAENYPIVWLTDESGDVYYCRSFDFSTMVPSKGTAPQTCKFTTPAGLPSGSYELFVSAVGVVSKDPFPFTTGVGGKGTGTGGASGAAGASGASGAGGASGSGGATGAGGSTGTAGNSGSGVTLKGVAGMSGAGGAGNGMATDMSGAGGKSGAGTGNGGATSKSGCGCHLASGSSPSALGASVLLLGLAALRARRRARR